MSSESECQVIIEESVCLKLAGLATLADGRRVSYNEVIKMLIAEHEEAHGNDSGGLGAAVR